MRNGRAARPDQGFSLIELLIAMVVTVIVTGTVFQLMSSSNTAFLREPEVADRQQSARVAMDRIWTDVLKAGSGMPAFVQVFDQGLNGIGGMGPGGEETDEIGFVIMADCPPLDICDPDLNGGSVTTFQTLDSCYQLPALVLLGNSDSEWGLFMANKPGGGTSASCAKGGGSGSRNGHVVFPKGTSDGWNPPGGKFGFVPTYMAVVESVRYRIAPETDGEPALWRSALAHKGGVADEWQLIARGVEDLQFEYFADGTWGDEPPTAADLDFGTVVQRVRINLSTRSDASSLQGSTSSAIGVALRGQLTSEVTPRAAMAVMSRGNAGY